MKHAIQDRLRAAYAEAFAAGRAPDFGAAELADWTKVADELVEGGELELGGYAVRRLNEAWPDFAWARNVADLLELMPPADPVQPAFADVFPSAVQTVRREGAQTALLVFCGAKHRLGMPLPMLHRWLARLPVSLVYLRDLSSQCYLGGVDRLGADIGSTLEALRALTAELGARRVVCYGNSVGGYGALRYGVELGADAVIGVAGLTNMAAAFNAHLHYAPAARALDAAFPDAPLDLRRLYQQASHPPRALMVYGEHNWDDRIHAEHMAGLPGVTLQQIDGYKGHNCAVELIRAGRFGALLEEALSG